jgi:hypothetical protein
MISSRNFVLVSVFASTKAERETERERERESERETLDDNREPSIALETKPLLLVLEAS